MAATNIEVWQSATVLEIETIATDIRRIVLAPQKPKKAEPGTHIDLKVMIGGEADKRSYSVVESIDNGQRLAISVCLAPTSRGGSAFMHTLEQLQQDLQS